MGRTKQVLGFWRACAKIHMYNKLTADYAEQLKSVCDFKQLEEHHCWALHDILKVRDKYDQYWYLGQEKYLRWIAAVVLEYFFNEVKVVELAMARGLDTAALVKIVDIHNQFDLFERDPWMEP